MTARRERIETRWTGRAAPREARPGKQDRPGTHHIDNHLAVRGEFCAKQACKRCQTPECPGHGGKRNASADFT
eukprot:3780502-Rhodomonas_salina.2